jgi:hypothetical protein
MIDWADLAWNALWILGCSLALGAFSYASWEASMTKERLRVRLARPGYKLIFKLAGLLFCAGLAGTADSVAEAVLWAVPGLVFLFGILFNFHYSV